MRLRTVSVAALILGLSTFLAAGPVSTSAPGANGTDWVQEFTTGNGGVPFTTIQSFLETPGVDFTGPFTGVPGLPAGWTASAVNSQYDLLTGPVANSDFLFDIGFTSAQNVPFTIDFDVWNGSTLETANSGSATWNGSSWSYGALLQEPGSENTTPEPASLLLLTTGLFALALLARRIQLPHRS